MVDLTDNHEFQLWADDEEQWEHRSDFETLEQKVWVRDEDAALNDYEPHDGALFLATDTEDVYLGDGNSWTLKWNLGDIGGGGDGSIAYDHISARVYQDGGTVIGYTHDGTQYTDSSLDTVIENLSSAVNGAIAIRAGTYDWTGMCTLSNNTHIKGVGEVILDIQSLNDLPAVSLDNVSENVSIEGIRFESDGTTDGGVSRDRSRTLRKDHIAVRDCVFTGFTNSVNPHVVNCDNWYNSEVKNCTFKDFSYSAIRLHAGGEGIIAHQNHIEVPPNTQMAIAVDGHKAIIKDNHINLEGASGDPSHGIFLNDINVSYPQEHTIISGNSFVAEPGNTGANGLYCTSDLSENLVVTENTFRNLARGLTNNLNPGTKITSNGFYNCGTGVTSDSNSGFRVADNEFIDCGDACRVTDAENVTFSGNYIQGCDYAFLEESGGGADNNILLFNHVDSSTISLEGANSEEHHTMSINTNNYSTNSSYYDYY